MDENELQRRVLQLEKLVNDLVFSDRYGFEKHLQLFDGKNIQLGRTTGTKIGTATDQKIGFFGETPVDQPATIVDPSGGAVQDSESRTAIIALIDRLQELGLIA